MAEFIEIIILSAIQGISEFIPVSSSAHLYLMSEVQNFEIKSLLTDVSLHLDEEKHQLKETLSQNFVLQTLSISEQMN